MIWDIFEKFILLKRRFFTKNSVDISMCKNQLWLKISKHYILNLLNLRNTQITRGLWKDGLVNECLLKVRVQLCLNYGKSESLFELKTQKGNKHFPGNKIHLSKTFGTRTFSWIITYQGGIIDAKYFLINVVLWYFSVYNEDLAWQI